MRNRDKTKQEKLDEVIQCLNRLAEHGILYGFHIRTRVVRITRGENNVYVWYEHSKASRPATATRDRFLRRRFLVDLSKLQ